MNFQNLRAIIIKDDKLVVMERWKGDEHFFVFPGGHIEPNEAMEECVTREVLEEFGIKIKPKKLIYTYQFGNSHQGFFVCDWLCGDIHRTDAEEYTMPNRNGEYNPTTIPLSQLSRYKLYPPQVARQLIKDLKTYKDLAQRDTIKL